jgi:hypothetical protein
LGISFVLVRPLTVFEHFQGPLAKCITFVYL